MLLGDAAFARQRKDPIVLRGLKYVADGVIRASLAAPALVLLLALLAVGLAGFALSQKESDFLPPFNEGSVQLNVLLPPGTSLNTSVSAAKKVEARLKKIDSIQSFVRKTGR